MVSCLCSQIGNNPQRFQARCNLSFSAAFAAFIATPAFAETHTWGGSSVDYSGGVVTFSNELTTGQRDFNVMLTDEGVTVLAIVMQNPGDAPDTLIVQPPPGWLAIPETISVEEGAQGVISIVPEGMS